jgi:HEAT repeat protein
MERLIVETILTTGAVFLVLTVVIIANKAQRELREGWRRARRRDLEPVILAWAHGDSPSVLSVLGGGLARKDRLVFEEIVLDHVQRIRGIERERLARTLDELGFVAHWRRRLSASGWWQRAEAAEKLGLAHAEKAADQLVVAMNDPMEEVRLRAAKALGTIGGKEAAEPLVRALSEPNRWSAIRIADILTDLGRDVAQELVERYPTLNRHGRLAALDILARVHSIQSFPFLNDRLADEDRDVRARAAHALGAIGDPAAASALTDRLGDPEWPVRAMSAKALGRIRHVPSIPSLCAAMRDREWWVRANAAEAVRSMGSPGIEALERMLSDDDAYARHQAVQMLQQAGQLELRVAQLASPDPEIRKEAESLVRRVAGIGQTNRLREAAENHSETRVRDALSAILPEAGNGSRNLEGAG